MAIESQAILVSKEWCNRIFKYFKLENEKTAESIKKLPQIPLNAQGIIPDRRIMLIDLFKDKVKYINFLCLLVAEGLVSEVTHHWIDFDKGNKTLLIVIIKKLMVLGYIKSDQRLSNLLIKEIIFNTFNVNVSIDHVKHVKHKDLNVNFLPSSDKMLL